MDDGAAGMHQGWDDAQGIDLQVPGLPLLLFLQGDVDDLRFDLLFRQSDRYLMSADGLLVLVHSETWRTLHQSSAFRLPLMDAS